MRAREFCVRLAYPVERINFMLKLGQPMAGEGIEGRSIRNRFGLENARGTISRSEESARRVRSRREVRKVCNVHFHLQEWKQEVLGAGTRVSMTYVPRWDCRGRVWA